MCGLAGFLAGPKVEAAEARSIISRMTNTLLRRGPDSSGVWCSSTHPIALGHRRLAVLDCSDAGAQPMHSANGRFVIAFNGEIYNHQTIRRSLETELGARGWRGHSDTETLLAALEAWGPDRTLRAAVGMFAFALWDTLEKTLLIARDRFGEKPLYYGWVGRGEYHSFVFGSELKALRAHPGFNNQISRTALAEYLRLLYVPAPLSIYERVFKLEPGCYLRVIGGPPSTSPVDAVEPGHCHQSMSVHRWWSVAEEVERGSENQFLDERVALTKLEETLEEAVRLQSLADVRVGAFLSGGIDSSLITALMQRSAGSRISTFTVGFEQASYDESAHARAVAQHLGTDHYEMFMTARACRDVVPNLPHIYDEPFADSSQIPTYLISRVARQQVTVALSGDAGDELFGGYNRYTWGPQLWKWVRMLPDGWRRVLAGSLHSTPPAVWDSLLSWSSVRRPGEKLAKLGDALTDVRSIDGLYRNLVSTWRTPHEVVLGATSQTMRLPMLPAKGSSHPTSQMMYWDATTYLPDDILCKVDRAAMAASLETRAPFLDHRVAQIAWRLPLHMKVRNGEGKWALRQLLYKHVPRRLLDRPKTGFSVPISSWLRNDLREWAEDLLHAGRLRDDGYFRPEVIQNSWTTHLTGRRDQAGPLWAVLMFQAWLHSQKCDSASFEQSNAAEAAAPGLIV